MSDRLRLLAGAVIGLEVVASTLGGPHPPGATEPAREPNFGRGYQGRFGAVGPRD